MLDITSSIKKLSIEATKSLILPDIVYGKVTNLKPLEVTIDNIETEVITSPFLEVLDNLTRKVFRIDLKHQHTVFDKNPEQIKDDEEIKFVGISTDELRKPIEIVINEGLKVNDTVAMLKLLGGQGFLVIGKLGDKYDMEEEVIVWEE